MLYPHPPFPTSPLSMSPTCATKRTKLSAAKQKPKLKSALTRPSRPASHGQQTPSSTTSSSEDEMYEDGVVKSTVQARMRLWQHLRSLVPPPPLSAAQISDAWGAVLCQQLEYAATHGLPRGSNNPMQWGSQISLLGRTIGALGRHAPHLGKPPKTWTEAGAPPPEIYVQQRNPGTSSSSPQTFRPRNSVSPARCTPSNVGSESTSSCSRGTKI